jgi:hypothetical protein
MVPCHHGMPWQGMEQHIHGLCTEETAHGCQG